MSDAQPAARPTIIERIAAYAADLEYATVPGDVADYAKRILLDSLACLFGGLDSEPARIVRRTVEHCGGHPEATVIGAATKTTSQHAGLCNGVAIRYQDYSDVYFGPAWTAHPSDNLGTLLAVAEAHCRSGRSFLEAMIVAYEVQLRFSDLPVERNLWHYGWHHTAACAYASAAGAGRLMGLDRAAIAHAIALSGARANTFSEIRHGSIPLDKALSAPITSSNAVFYALLAQQGFTGSLTLLEGPYGFRHAVARGVDVEPLVPLPDDFRIRKIGLKPYPIEGMTPAMVEAALTLRERHGIAPEEVRSIRIRAHEEAVTKPSWDSKKLRPDSKETADHSFFYCVAVALAAGACTSRQFEPEWLADPVVHRLIDACTIEARPEMTALFKQGARPAGVDIETGRGTFSIDVFYPLGDPRNPLQWSDVCAKFLAQAEPVLGTAAERVIEAVMGIAEAPDLTGLLTAMQPSRAR